MWDLFYTKKKISPLKFGSSSFLEVRTYDLDVA